VFQFPDGAAVFGEKRANYFVGSRENAVDINRIFRYPSRLYKGQELADTAPPPTPAVGSISQGPGSIAQVGGTGNQATIYNAQPPDRHVTEGLRLALAAVAASLPEDSAKWLQITSENTNESNQYAEEIKKVLGDKASDWQVNMVASTPVPYGVHILTGGDKTPTFSVANRLAEAFYHNGVAVHFEKASDLDSTSKQIVILVGLKK
jgi:hypothetical protein